ncbi:unnamed protein product [Blepharisma stoltei]|uniref:Protein kinase domain-containing protein n=1 Tax=Blepharisma stoltei TaxID=1481888 RepID=A0AAU9IP19_9CILI|nr:unnamed protein product [Blepharisma stoltei]
MNHLIEEGVDIENKDINIENANINEKKPMRKRTCSLIASHFVISDYKTKGLSKNSSIENSSDVNIFIANNKIDSTPNISPKPKILKPETNISCFSKISPMSLKQLSATEKRELALCNKIYYFPITRKILPKYYDKDGNYIGTPKDHICYRYEIIKKIGSGSFGQVFKCFDHKANNFVAIKILKRHFQFRKIGNDEAKLLGFLNSLDQSNSKYIIKIQKRFDFRGHVCLSQELLGDNLYQFIQSNNGKLNLNTIKIITKQLLIALNHIHDNMIIHCDLKPENILFKNQENLDIKLIDFGSSCKINEGAFGAYMQSRYYRAPEVVLRLNLYTAIDMWSLGCVIVELHTGLPLFPARDQNDLLNLIMCTIGTPSAEFLRKVKDESKCFAGNKEFLELFERRNKKPTSKCIENILDNCDEEFVDFVKKCIVWDPELRITAKEGLYHSWISRI